MSNHMKNIIYLPKDEAVKPREGHCYVDRWWIVHPEKGLAFYLSPHATKDDRFTSPQCNSNKAVTEVLHKKMYSDHEIKFFTAVYVGRVAWL